MRYVHSRLPETRPLSESGEAGTFNRVEVSEGTLTWHKVGKGDPSVDLGLYGPAGASLVIELRPEQADDIARRLLEHRVGGTPSPELVDQAAVILQHAGWYESGDGALNPPSEQVLGFTVQVRALTADEAEKALLRRLRAGGDRDRFRVEVAGEKVWDGRD